MYDRCSITISLPTGNELEYPYATFNLLKIQISLLIHPMSTRVLCRMGIQGFCLKLEGHIRYIDARMGIFVTIIMRHS